MIATAARNAPPQTRRPAPALLRQGNTKLGPHLIWTFSLPAIATCPGSTASCRSACYATKGRYAFAGIKGAYARNWDESRRRDFAATVATQIRRSAIQVVRIHGSGDFYSPAYVARWVKIATMRRDTTFYAYTRSWSKPPLRRALARLALLPNVHLWYSGDSESGPPPAEASVRTAWMIAAGEPAGSVPASADLAFRVKEDGPLKRANGVLVCPYENDVPIQTPRITCDVCRICFSGPRTKKD